MPQVQQDMQVPEVLEALHTSYDRLRAEIAKVIVGQDEIIRHLFVGFLSQGHVLLIGVPGLAKTLLIRTISQATNLKFSRIQFTPDLMPGDITGTEIIEEDVSTGRRSFKFVRDPSSPMSCWRTRSIERPRKPRRPCWKPCRSTM